MKNRLNKISKNKILSAILISVFLLQMFSILATGPSSAYNKVWFFVDDFDDEEYSRDNWNGAFNVREYSSKIVVKDGQIAITNNFDVIRDITSEVWLLIENIATTKLSSGSTITLQDGNTKRVLYTLTKNNIDSSTVHIQIPGHLIAGIDSMCIELSGYMSIGSIKLYSPNRYYHDFLTDGFTFENHPLIEDTIWSYGSGYTKNLKVPLTGNKIILESPSVYIPWQPVVNFSFFFDVSTPVSYEYDTYNYTYTIKIFNLDDPDQPYGEILDSYTIYESWNYPAFNTFSLTDYCGQKLKFEFSFSSPDIRPECTDDVKIIIYLANIFTNGYSDPVSEEFSPWEFIHSNNHAYYDIATFFGEYYPVLATDREGYLATYFVENSHLRYVDYLTSETIQNNYTTEDVSIFEDLGLSGVLVNNTGSCEAVRKDINVGDFYTDLVFTVSSYDIIAGISISGYKNIKFGIGRTNDKPTIFIYVNDAIDEIIFLNSDYNLLEDNIISVETTFGYNAYLITLNGEEHYYTPSSGEMAIGGYMGFFSKCSTNSINQVVEFKSISVFGPVKRDSSRFIMLIKSSQDIKVEVTHTVFDLFGIASVESLGAKDVLADKDAYIHFQTPDLRRLEYLQINIINDDSERPLQTPVYLGPMLVLGINPFDTKINPINYFDIGKTSEMIDDTLFYSYDPSNPDNFIASYDINIREPCLFEVGVFVDNILPRISIDVYARKLFSAEPYSFQGTITWTENEENVFGHVIFLDFSYGDYEIVLQHPHDAYEDVTIHYILTRPITSSAIAHTDYTDHNLENVWQLDFNANEAKSTTQFDVWEEDAYYTLHKPLVENILVDGVFQQLTDWDDVSNAVISPIEGNLAAFIGSVTLEDLNIPIDHSHFPYIYFEIYSTNPLDITKVTFEDNNGNQYEFTIIPNNIQDNSLTKSFILANVIGEDPDGDGRVEDSSLKLDKITFDSYQCSYPVIFKNIHIYRIKNVETFDDHDNTEYAPYVSNTPYYFERFYVNRVNDINYHHPYTSEDMLADLLENDDYNLSLEDLSWFLQERDGLKPLFISNSNQPWKYNKEPILNVPYNGPLLPNYLSPAGTTLELIFSVPSLANDSRNEETLIELNFVDALRDKLSGMDYWFGDNSYEYVIESPVNAVYNIKLTGQLFKITEDDGPFEGSIPDAKIIWFIDDNWSEYVIADNSYSILPFDTSYIYYDKEYKITIDYGRPYYDPLPSTAEYIHNVAYSPLYDFNWPSTDFLSDDNDDCGNFGGFTVSFDEDILLGGTKEDKNSLTNPFGDLSKISNLNKYPLFTQTFLTFGAAPLSYDMDWTINQTFFPNYEEDKLSLLNYESFEINVPAISQMKKDSFSVGDYLILPTGSSIQPILNANLDVSEYYFDLSYGGGTLTLETDTEGWNQIFGEHYLTEVHNYVYEKLTNSTLPALENIIFSSIKEFYAYGQDLGYTSSVDNLLLTFFTHTPSSYLSLDGSNAIGGDWSILDQNPGDTMSYSIDSGPKGIKWLYDSTDKDFWEQNSFYLNNYEDMLINWGYSLYSPTSSEDYGLFADLHIQEGIPNSEQIYDDYYYIMPADDLPLRVVNYNGLISNKFLLRTQFRVDSWKTEDLPSLVSMTSSALILPGREVLRIKVLHYGYDSDIDFTTKYTSDTLVEELEEQEITYVYIGNELIGAFSNDQEVIIDFEILIERNDQSSPWKYIINIRCDTPRHEEPSWGDMGDDKIYCGWHYNNEDVIPSDPIHVDFKQEIMVGTNVYSEYIIEGIEDRYGYDGYWDGSYTWEPTFGSHKIAFENETYLTNEVDYRINSVFNDDSFSFMVGFGNDQFTYIDYIPIADSFDEEEILELEGDYSWSGTTGIGTAYPDSLIMYPNSKFRFVDKLSGNLDITFDLNLFLLDIGLDNSFEIGLAKVDTSANYYYNGIKFSYDIYNQDYDIWTSLAQGENEYINYNPEVTSHLSTSENFFVRLQYDETTHTMRFWIWKWDEIIDLDNYIEYTIDINNLESIGVKPYISVGGSLLFVHSIFSNTFHYENDEILTQLPSMNGQGELGDFYLSYNTDLMLNCTGSMDFVYSTEDGTSNPAWNMDFMPLTDFETIITNEYYNDTINEWITVGYIKITHNNIHFGNNSDLLLQITSSDVIKNYEWNYISLNYYYSPIVEIIDGNNVTIREGEFILVINEEEYSFNTSVIVDSGKYRYTLSNSKGSVYYDNIQVFNYIEYFSTLENFEDGWESIIKGGYWDISINAYTTNLYLTVIGCSIHDGLSNITIIINDDHILKDVWKQSSPFPNLEYHRYPINLNVIGGSPNNILKLRFISQGLTSVYGFSLSTKESVTDILYTAETYNLEEQRVWNDMNSRIVSEEEVDYSVETDSSAIINPILVHLSGTIDYVLETIDIKEGLTFSGFVKGIGKIVIEEILCRGNYHIKLEFTFGEENNWYEGLATYTVDEYDHIYITASFPLTLFEEDDDKKWQYFEIDLYQALAHIPAYDGEIGEIDNLSLKYSTRAFNFDVIEIIPNIQTIEDIIEPLYFADFKYSLERSNIGEFPSSESKITIGEEEQTSALWKIKELDKSGVIDIDTIFERAIVPNTVDNYYFMVYADSISSETIFIEIDSDLPFTVYQSGIAIYTKNDFKRNNAFIPINVLGGISPILFKIVRPSGHPNHLMRISYIAFGDVSIGGSIFQQNEYITQWLHTQPFSSEVLHNTEGLIALINDICPKKSDRLKTPYGDLEFEQVELTEESYVDFSSDMRFTPSNNEYAILYTNLYFAKELENAEFIIQKGLDNNFGFNIKLLTIDSFQMIQNDGSLFNEVDTLSDIFTIPLLDVYTIPTPSIDSYREFDLLRPRLDEGIIWADPDSVTHHPDNDGQFDLSERYNHTLNLNSKGFHRVLILVEFTDTFQPLNISIRIKNRADKVFELLEPSPLRIDYHFTLSRLDTIMYESKPFDEVAGGTGIIDNEHVLAGGFFRDDLGGFHNYRIYFLGASDFETLLEVESYYRLDEIVEDDWGNRVPQIYDGSEEEVILASYVLFNMNFAIKIDEGFSNNYINTYSITAGRWWFRTIPDENGTYEMVTAPAVPILDSDELSQINSELGSLSLISSTSTDTACYTVGETEIILDGLGQSRANFVYDPATHGEFTAEGYTIDGYTLMEGDFVGDDIYQSNPATTHVSFNEYSDHYIDLLDLDSGKDSSTHYLAFTNITSNVETVIIRTVGLNTKIIIDANDNDFIWTLHNKYIEVVPKADTDKYKKTYITSTGSFTIYSNNLDNPDYNGTYNVFDKPETILAIQSKIDLPYEIPLSLSTYEDPEYLDPTKSSFAEWFKKLIIQCFNQASVLDMSDAMTAAYKQTGSLAIPDYEFTPFNLADYNVQDQVNLMSVDISGLNYIDVRILQDVFNLDVMEDRFTDWMEGILDLILSSYDPFEGETSHSTWYKVSSFIKKAFRIAWSVIKFFWRLLTGFKLGTTGDKPEMYQQRTDYSYTKFHSTFMFFWALIMGNSEGAGMPLSYYTGETGSYTVLDEDKCSRTHSILEFDYIWDTYLDHIASKSISNVNSKQLPFANSAYADAVANSSDPELANMRDWITSPNYQPEAYNMCERDTNIFLWFKSVFLKYGPYSIGVYTKEMMDAGTKPFGFDDNYLIIAVCDDTGADGDSYKWLISLDKHYKLSIDQVYIEFGINELELLTTIEMLANIFPVIALYEDIRDSIIVSNPFFRALSRIQIPMDIVDIFTRVRVISSLVNTAYKNAKLVEGSFGALVNQAQHSLKMRKAIGLSNSLRTAWSYLEYTVFLPWGLFQGSMKLFMKAFGKALIKSNQAFARLPAFLRSALFLEILIKKQRVGPVFAVIDTFGTRLTEFANNGVEHSYDFVKILTPSTFFSQMNEVTASETMVHTSLTYTTPTDSAFSGKVTDFVGSVKGDIDGIKSMTNDHTDRLKQTFVWGKDGKTEEKIDEYNKWLQERLELFGEGTGVPGKSSGHFNSIQQSLILALRGIEMGVDPKDFIDSKTITDLDSILREIKKNWYTEVDQDGNMVEVYPAWVQHLVTFRDLFTDASKGEKAIDRWKNIGDNYKNTLGELSLSASIIDLYLVIQASNHNLKHAVNEELKKLTDNGVTITEAKAKEIAAKTFHTLIRNELTKRGAAGEVLPMTGKVLMGLTSIGTITVQDGIYKFDVNKIELEGEIIKFTDDWGPITMDTDYISNKGPNSINAENYRQMLTSRLGFDIPWINGAAEVKNSGKDSISPSEVQNKLGRSSMSSFALFLKSGAIPNYFKDLDIDTLTPKQIEEFLIRDKATGEKREFDEINLMRLLNTFTTTINEKSTGLRTDPEQAKRDAFKLVLQTMFISGVTVNLVFLTKNVFSAEIATVAGDTTLLPLGYRNGDGKFTIDIDGAYHPSVNSKLLQLILSHDNSKIKNKFQDPEVYIEAAFMTLVPQARLSGKPFRSICFVINKGDGSGERTNYIISYQDFKDLESYYYVTNPTKPSLRSHILEVHLLDDGEGVDNTGKLCLGAGIDIETDIDGKSDVIIKYNTESVNDETNLFKMVHFDNKKFPDGDSYKTIFLSPYTFDLVGTDGANGGFYLTVRNQHGNEIDDMMKIRFNRGIVGCDFKTNGAPNSNSYKYQRVFLYGLLTADLAPYLKVQKIVKDGKTFVSVAYEWLPTKHAKEELIKLKNDIKNADVDTKKQLTNAIYDTLKKFQGIKDTKITDTNIIHDAVIARLDNTIDYYSYINEQPRIDCYTQEVDKFNINNEIPEKEIISNPYYLVYEHNFVMDTSLLSLDEIMSNYLKNVKNVMDAFTESSDARHLVMGGDGTHLRLLDMKDSRFTELGVKKIGEDSWYYQHNAMDGVDYKQAGLIHNIYYDYLADKMGDASIKEIMDAFKPPSDDTRVGNKGNLFRNLLKKTYSQYLRHTSFYKRFKTLLDNKNNNDFTDCILKDIKTTDPKKAQEEIYKKILKFFKTHKHLGPALDSDMFVIKEVGGKTKIFFLDKDPIQGSHVLTSDSRQILCNVEILKSLITKLGGGEPIDKEIRWADNNLDTSKKIFSNDIPLIQLIYNSYGKYGIDTVRNTLKLLWTHIAHNKKPRAKNTFALRYGELSDQELISSMTVLGIVERLNDYSLSIRDQKAEYKYKMDLTDLRAIVVSVKETEPGTFKVEIKFEANPQLSTNDVFTELQKLHYLIPEALTSDRRIPKLFEQFNRAVDNFNKPYEQPHRYTSKYDEGPYKVTDKQNNFMPNLVKFINFWAKGGMFDKSNK